MLTYVANEIAPMHQPAVASSGSSTDIGPRSRARTLSQDPVIARRQQIERTFASIFAEAMIRAPVTLREKEKKAGEERRREVVEVFLRARREEAS